MMNLIDISLPKWPQMIVAGKPVTVEQAKDIIFRTDRFLTEFSEYSGGNYRKFNKEYRDKAGITSVLPAIIKDRQLRDEIYDELRVIWPDIRYVLNDWGSSNFIGGPHGWCSPSGKISYRYNVGKWPSVQEIQEDWQEIATAFPYLDLNVTLMSGESCEEDTSQPLVNIRVLGGIATLQDPDLSVHSKREESDESKGDFDIETHSEIGLPLEWYNEFAAMVKATIEEVLKDDL